MNKPRFLLMLHGSQLGFESPTHPIGIMHLTDFMHLTGIQITHHGPGIEKRLYNICPPIINLTCAWYPLFISERGSVDRVNLVAKTSQLLSILLTKAHCGPLLPHRAMDILQSNRNYRNTYQEQNSNALRWTYSEVELRKIIARV